MTGWVPSRSAARRCRGLRVGARRSKPHGPGQLFGPKGLELGRKVPTRCEVFAVPIGAAATRRLVTMVAALRDRGVSADLAYGERGLTGTASR